MENILLPRMAMLPYVYIPESTQKIIQTRQDMVVLEISGKLVCIKNNKSMDIPNSVRVINEECNGYRFEEKTGYM